jgi:hypothetical protein
MGADSEHDQNIGTDGPVCVTGIIRLLFNHSGIRIRQIAHDAGELQEHGLVTAQYPNWLAAPFHNLHLPRGQISYINFDRRSARSRTGAGFHTGH